MYTRRQGAVVRWRVAWLREVCEMVVIPEPTASVTRQREELMLWCYMHSQLTQLGYKMRPLYLPCWLVLQYPLGAPRCIVLGLLVGAFSTVWCTGATYIISYNTYGPFELVVPLYKDSTTFSGLDPCRYGARVEHVIACEKGNALAFEVFAWAVPDLLSAMSYVHMSEHCNQHWEPWKVMAMGYSGQTDSRTWWQGVQGMVWCLRAGIFSQLHARRHKEQEDATPSYKRFVL